VRFWLIEIGEPLPIDSGSRLLRTGMLAHELTKKGHQVDWWCSTFDHFRKFHRFEKSTQIDSTPTLRLKLIHGPGYKKNKSLRRIFHQRALAKEFKKLTRTETPPDLILCSMPTIELSNAAGSFAKAHNIPVVLDLRDMWPDVYLEVMPRLLRPIARPLLQPFYRQLRQAGLNATAIFAITPEFLEWGLKRVGKSKGPSDRHFWHSYTSTTPSEKDAASAKKFWANEGLSPSDFIICFFGTMSLELETAIEAARTLQPQHPEIKFVFCGTGDRLEHFKHLAKGANNVLFPGWVNRSQIWQLMRLSSAGLAPYPNRPDFLMSIPNKVVEYFSGGLPILTGLEGRLKSLLESKHCGLNYQNDHPDTLVEQILFLTTNPEQRNEMATNAKELFFEEFDAEKVFGNMAGHLESIALQGRN